MAATTTPRLDDAASSGRRRVVWIARLLCLAIAVVTLAWVIAATIPVFEGTQLNAVSRRIVMHESFRIASLEKIEASTGVPSDGLGCNEQNLRGILLIRSVLAEDALNRGDIAQIDARFPVLSESARALLRCSPYQGIGWFVLYWASLNQVGATREALSYLDMSYKVAPREAWIGVMRNSQALRVTEMLPDDFQTAVANEWRDLVKAGLHDFAAVSITQARPALRARLVAVSATIPPTVLRAFARQLLRAGTDIEFPTLPKSERFLN